MARTNRGGAVPFDGLTAAEQAEIDTMRENDLGPLDDAEPNPVNAGAEAGETDAGTAEAPAADEPAAAAQQRSATVPHAALHEERELRKAAEQRLAELERQAAEDRQARQTLEERTNILLHRLGQGQQPQQQQTEQPAAIPSPEEDPVGHIIAKIRQQEAVLGNVVQTLSGRSQQDQQMQAAQALQMRTAAMENEYRAKQPDYDTAARHLVEMRHRQLAAAGITDPAERQSMLTQEAFGLAAQAARQNRNPAEIVYELAKIAGYQPPAAEAAEQNAEPPAQNESERIATIAQGQQHARTLGNVRGASPPPLSAQTLTRMTDAEFRAFADKATPAQLRAVLGA